jgi:hypothetical protein
MRGHVTGAAKLMARPDFCSYLTRRMLVEIRDRLRDEAHRRTAARKPNNRMEDIVNEALDAYLPQLRGRRNGSAPRTRAHVDWDSVPNERDVLVPIRLKGD